MTTRRLKTLILIALTLCAGVGVGFYALRSHLLDNPELLLEKVAKNVDLSLQQMDYTQITDGRKEWTLEATQVDYLLDDDQFTLRDVSVTLFPNGGGEVKLYGNNGQYNRKGNWLKVTGSAGLSSTDGFDLTGEEFTFNLTSQVLTSGSRILLSGPGFRVSGERLTVKVEAWEMTIEGDVESELTSSSEETTGV